MNAQKLASGLAWFSVGLGLYETFAPKHLCRLLGLDGKEGLIRFYGLREIGAGLGIFATQPNPAPWVWARASGDVLDLATLGTAFREDNPKQGNALVAVLAVLGVTVLDFLCAETLTAGPAKAA